MNTGRTATIATVGTALILLLAAGSTVAGLPAVRTVEVQGVQIAENTPVLGIVLESLGAGQGLIWVLVNPH